MMMCAAAPRSDIHSAASPPRSAAPLRRREVAKLPTACRARGCMVRAVCWPRLVVRHTLRCIAYFLIIGLIISKKFLAPRAARAEFPTAGWKHNNNHRNFYAER